MIHKSKPNAKTSDGQFGEPLILEQQSEIAMIYSRTETHSKISKKIVRAVFRKRKHRFYAILPIVPNYKFSTA